MRVAVREADVGDVAAVALVLVARCLKRKEANGSGSEEKTLTSSSASLVFHRRIKASGRTCYISTRFLMLILDLIQMSSDGPPSRGAQTGGSDLLLETLEPFLGLINNMMNITLGQLTQYMNFIPLYFTYSE